MFQVLIMSFYTNTPFTLHLNHKWKPKTLQCLIRINVIRFLLVVYVGWGWGRGGFVYINQVIIYKFEYITC